MNSLILAGPPHFRLFRMAKNLWFLGIGIATLSTLFMISMISVNKSIDLDEVHADDIIPESSLMGGDGSGTRWARYRADLKPIKNHHSDSTYEGELSTRFSNKVNPYKDFPYTSRRGLPLLDDRYAVPYNLRAYRRAGSRPIYSADQAQDDLDALHEFGLVSDDTYNVRSNDIKAAEGKPFGSKTMFARDNNNAAVDLDDPKSWTGETKMCREVSTHVNGLNNQGWAELTTLKCCSFLCSHSQYLTFRDGELHWGVGKRNRYSSAVPIDGPAHMEDGRVRYLCRTCAWDPEPSWSEMGLDKLPKMEGHIGEPTAE